MPSLAGVVPLNQIKDDGQVFLRIRRGNPAGILGMAAEEAENVRHGESLWLVQHGLLGYLAPMRVKRPVSRDPFTQRENLGTDRQRFIHEPRE